MAIRYSFRTYRYRMSKPLKTLPVSPPDRRGVFGQRGKALRVGLYARVSTHDQKTLPLQLSAMRDYAKKRRWAVAVEVQDVGSGATTRPQREKHRGGPTAGDRFRPGRRLDRWGQSRLDVVNTLQELRGIRVPV